MSSRCLFVIMKLNDVGNQWRRLWAAGSESSLHLRSRRPKDNVKLPYRKGRCRQAELRARVLFRGEMTSNELQRLRLRAQSVVTRRRQMFLSKGNWLSSRKPKYISICLIKPSKACWGGVVGLLKNGAELGGRQRNRLWEGMGNSRGAAWLWW